MKISDDKMRFIEDIFLRLTKPEQAYLFNCFADNLEIDYDHLISIPKCIEDVAKNVELV